VAAGDAGPGGRRRRRVEWPWAMGMAARREAAVTGNEEGGSGARERGHRRERATRWLRRWGSAAAPVMGIYCSSGDGDLRRSGKKRSEEKEAS